MSLFGKIVSFILNDALVKTLANSKTFQRFALKTDAMAKSAKVAGTDAVAKAEQVAKDKIKEQVSKVENAKPSDEGFSFYAFVQEFKTEMASKAPAKLNTRTKAQALASAKAKAQAKRGRGK